jgi:2-polyprenyl-3-methyl-5-hydroxy-6-metoxy-1,4-benzoquinol methylase
MTLKEQFDSYGQWKTQFIIEGQKYGGMHSYKGDPRIRDFFAWCDKHESILELGSCEGGHTALLSEKAQSVIGIEGKEHLIKRAQFAMQALGISNCEFRKANFDECISISGILESPVDAVFCSGILYHLKSPWNLIKEISKVTDRLYLATHYATEKDAFCVGYCGKFMEDGSPDDWAGITPYAFWFTLPSLMDCLEDNGFHVEHIMDWKKFGTSPYPMAGMFCRRK